MENKPYSNLTCPNCGRKGDFEKDTTEETYCTHCGVIIKSPYPFTAGIRFKTLTEMLIDKKFEEINKKRWRRYNEKFQKI